MSTGSEFARPGDDADLADDIRWAAEQLAKGTAGTRPPVINQAIVAGLTPVIKNLTPEAWAALEDAAAHAEPVAKILNTDEPPGAADNPVTGLVDRMSPKLEPFTADAPNVLSGHNRRTPDQAAKIAALMSAHRHPVTGKFQSPSRSASAIQAGAAQAQGTGAGAVTQTPLGFFKFHRVGQSGPGPE
jgi:hypothetical protein